MMNRPTSPLDTGQERLAFQNEIRRLELELESCRRELARARGELELAHLSRQELASEQAESRQERLFQLAAAPAAQLLTQAHLLENANRPLQARDVLAVARRLLSALQQSGLAFSGQPGQVAAFDPDHHALLSSAAELEPGRPVVIRFVEVTYNGKTLARAGVEPAEETA